MPASADDVSTYYDDIAGPHFVGTTFESNLHVHLASTAYERHLSEFFPRPGRRLADLGCGDGRHVLWALERGFQTVVAVDRTHAALRRLVAAARERGLAERLVAVEASFTSECLAPAAYDAVLAIESFLYLGDAYATGLAAIARLLSDGGRGVVSEFCRAGKVLSDVVALNVENMAKVAAEGRRFEKSDGHKVVQRLFTIEELVGECERAGLAVTARRGISPIPMLFHYVHSLTSYPLRPRLDAGMRKILEALDSQTSGLSEFSRNIVLLVGRTR